jgi:DNA processing protein
VLAVPGEITSALSAGTNALLRNGAAPLLAPGDALAAAGLEAAPPVARPRVEGAAAQLLAFLDEAPAAADELVRRSGLGAEEVAAALVRLELEGLAAERDGVYRATS